MKNCTYKKIVALTLAVMLLLGSGIGAALAGIDFINLAAIKTSAEDPHEDIFYDADKGLFFEVVGGRARILGSDREAVLASSDFADGTYTLPNIVKNSLTGIEYYVFELSDYALFNFRLDVKKLIIPDNFRSLLLPEASFAGWDNLTEVEWDVHNATVLGPLFEWLCEFTLVGDICNAFPVRDEYGSPVFNDEGTEVLVRFYSTEVHNGFTTDYYDMYCPFDDALNHYSPQTLTNINTVSKKDVTITSSYWFEIYKKDIKFDDVDVGIYSLPFNPDYHPESCPETEYDWNTYSYKSGIPLETGTLAIGADYDPLRQVGTGYYPDRGHEEFAYRTATDATATDASATDASATDATLIPEQPLAGTVDFGEAPKSDQWAGPVSGPYYNPQNGTEDNEESHHPYSDPLGTVRGNATEPDSLIDGNASYHETNTIALHKSPIKTLTLGKNVKHVPDFLCYDLEIDTIDFSNVTSLGHYSFVDCNALTSIDLSNIEEIPEWCFASCDGLTSLDLSSAKAVNDWAFAACDGLPYITIPEGLTYLGAGAFSFSDGLKAAYFNATDCEIGASEIDAEYFGCRPSVKSLFTPFTECKLLTAIVFGNGVTVIPSNIANNVTTLKEITFQGDITKIEDSAFTESDSIANITMIDPAQWEFVEIGENNESILFDDITFNAHEHTYTLTTVPPTCTEDGFTAEICSVCGAISDKGKTVKEKLGHDVAEPTVIEPTCTAKGYTTGKCSRCNETVEYDYVDATGHNFVETVIAPTCKAGGYTAEICSACGAISDKGKYDTVGKAGHQFGEDPIESVNPTCVKDGYDLYECTVCGKTEKTTIPKLGHNVTNKTKVAPTCTEQGYSSGKCTRCGSVIKTDYVNALGHDFANYVYNNDATAKKDGTETGTCTRCGAKDTRTASGTALNSGPLSSDDIIVKSSDTVDYKSKVTITAYGKNIPLGYSLAIFDGNTLLSTGNSKSVSYYAGEVTKGKTFSVRILDSKGSVVKGSSGQNIEKEIKVNVNDGLFNRLIAFFKTIFNRLPEVEIAP